MRYSLAPMLILAIACAASADVEFYTLDNGLRVVLDEMHFAPTAVVMLQYMVGSRNETPENSGISHFTEHMLFNGTADMPGQRFWQLVQKDGGAANGGTGQATTTYFIYLPSSKLENAIRIEADRMQNCLMDSAAIAQEIGVVTDEWRLSQDSPDGRLYRLAGEAWYGDHPLGMPVLGTGETIAAYDEILVRDYYETWYRPSNAVLVIAGDFDSDQARVMVDRYFGEIPCDGPSPHQVPEVIEPETAQRIDLDYPAESDRFLIRFPGVEYGHPDFPALLLLSYHFSSNRLGWMEREMVNTGLLTTGYGSSPYGLDRTPFSFYGNITPGLDADSVISVLTDEVFRLREEPLDEQRLEMLQSFLMARELNRITTPREKAYRHAYDVTYGGAPGSYMEILERAVELTPEDLREAAERYFDPERMTLAVLHATEGGGEAPSSSTAGTTETAVPEVSDWSGLDLNDDFDLPENSISQGVERFVLGNGLTLLVKEDHSFPNVEIMASFPMCARRESPELCGLSRITAELMQRGTTELDYDAFHERLAVLGSSTWIQAMTNYSLANVYGLSEHTGIYFTSLADMLIRPALSEEDFESVKTTTLGYLSRMNEVPYGIAYQEIDGVLLAEGNARTATMETVETITHQDAVNWWRTCVRPEETVIAVVGDITPDEALSLSERHFGNWSNPNTPLPELVRYEFSSLPGDTLVVSMPGKIQVYEIAAVRGPGYMDDDLTAFRVMSGILGGGIGSRLGQKVRESLGLAYMVGAWIEGSSSGSLSGSRFMGVLSTGAPFAGQALAAMLEEMNGITSGNVLEEELLLEQSRTIGRNAISYDSYDSQARYFVNCETMGLPLDHDLMVLREISELTLDDIREVSEKYISGEWFVVVAGGVDQDLQPLEAY